MSLLPKSLLLAVGRPCDFSQIVSLISTADVGYRICSIDFIPVSSAVCIFPERWGLGARYDTSLDYIFGIETQCGGPAIANFELFEMIGLGVQCHIDLD